MKKMMVAMVFCVFALGAQADVEWSWWCENKDESPTVAFGVGSECSSVKALELSLVYGATPNVKCVQVSLLGLNKSTSPHVQVGFLNFVKKSIVGVGFLNFSDKSMVQVGLLNFNKRGFLPVFPFVNLDKELFD
jgi:hypothetical protein